MILIYTLFSLVHTQSEIEVVQHLRFFCGRNAKQATFATNQER